MGYRRKMHAASLCKSIMFSIQWFQIHHIINFSTIYNKVVGLSGARVSPFHALVPQLIVLTENKCQPQVLKQLFTNNLEILHSLLLDPSLFAYSDIKI